MQKVRGRRLVAIRPLMQETAAGGLLLDAFSRGRLIARSVGGIAIVSVGDAHGHRDRRGPLAFERRNFDAQGFRFGRIRRVDDLFDFAWGHVHRADHLVRQQHLARRPLRFGCRDCLLHILRESQILSRQQLSPIGLFNRGHREAALLHFGIDPRVGRLIRRSLSGRNERMIYFDDAEKGGLQAIVVALRNRIELMVVAAGALHGKPQQAAAHGRDHVIEILIAKLGVVLLAKANLGVIT